MAGVGAVTAARPCSSRAEVVVEESGTLPRSMEAGVGEDARTRHAGEELVRVGLKTPGCRDLEAMPGAAMSR